MTLELRQEQVEVEQVCEPLDKLVLKYAHELVLHTKMDTHKH